MHFFGAVNVPSNVRLGNDRKRVFISFSPMHPLELGETISGNHVFAAFLEVSDKISLVALILRGTSDAYGLKSMTLSTHFHRCPGQLYFLQ